MLELGVGTQVIISKRAPMSNKELANRKKVVGAAAITTSTLGLGALAAKGGAAGFLKAGKVASAAGNASRAVKAEKVAHHLNRGATGALFGASGVGGAAGYNFASVQRAEARRRAPKLEEASKAYDPEEKRHKRNEKQVKVLNAASPFAVGAAGIHGYKSTLPKQRILTNDRYMKEIAEHRLKYIPKNETGNIKSATNVVNRSKQALYGSLRARNKAGAITTGLGALGVGGLVAANRIKSYSAKKGGSYKPRYRPGD